MVTSKKRLAFYALMAAVFLGIVCPIKADAPSDGAILEGIFSGAIVERLYTPDSTFTHGRIPDVVDVKLWQEHLLRETPMLLKYIHADSQTIWMAQYAIEGDGRALQYVAEKWKTPSLCLLACRSCYDAKLYVPEWIWKNPTFQEKLEFNRTMERIRRESK